MAIDTPARIAVIGAGPVGLEAALYGRYLGYDVDLFERGETCQHVLQWQHVTMFSTWRHLTSPLGRAAIESQFGSRQWPDSDTSPTGREWLETYLLPLAQTDLLADHIRTHHRVVSVSRTEHLKTDTKVDRRDWTLRLVVEDASGVESAIDADVVFDTTGVWGQPNWLGAGGAPAVGEQRWHERIVRWLPDVLGTDRETFAGRRTLVVGGGTSAATAVRDLLRLADQERQTHVTWVHRRPRRKGPAFLLACDTDRHRGISKFLEQVQELEVSGHPALEIYGESWVESITWDSQKWRVTLGGRCEQEWEGDHVVALVGYHPDLELFRELQVDTSPVWECGMAMAKWLEQPPAQRLLGADAVGRLDRGEPDFYVLGAKSYGRRSDFFYWEGLLQIRDLFTRLGDRTDLDLYASYESNWAQPDS